MFLLRFALGLLAGGGILFGLWFGFTHYYEHKGAAPYVAAQKVTRQQATADTATMAQTSTAVGAQTAQATASVAVSVKAAGKEIDNEFAKPAGPIVCAPSLDVGSLSAPLNGLVSGADGAADAAVAARRAGEAGAA